MTFTFKIPGNFCLWNPKSGKILLVGFGNRNTAQGIWNPTNVLNPESKFHWQILKSEIHGVGSRILHWASLSCLRKHQVIRSERHKEHKLLCKNYKFFYLFSVNNLQCVVMHSKLPVNAVSARWVDGAVMETKMTNACSTMNKRKRMRWSNWLKNKQKAKI